MLEAKGGRYHLLAGVLATLIGGESAHAELGDMPAPPTQPSSTPYVTPPPAPGIDDHSASVSPPGYDQQNLNPFTLYLGTDAQGRLEQMSALVVASPRPIAQAFLQLLGRPSPFATFDDVITKFNRGIERMDLQRGQTGPPSLATLRRNYEVALKIKGMPELLRAVRFDEEDLPPGITQDILREAKEATEKNEPPNQLLFLTGDARLIGDRMLFSVPGVTYSHIKGLDASIQPYFGSGRGFAVSLRQELTPRRHDDFSAALEKHRTARRALKTFRDAPGAPELRALSKVRTTAMKLSDEVDTLSSSLRVGLHLGFQRASALAEVDGGRNYSNRFLAGLSVSHLSALKGDLELHPDSSGVFWSASAQYAVVDHEVAQRQGGDSQVSGLRLSLRLGWQDAVPHFSYSRNELYRWRWQTGIEIVPDGPTSDATLIAGFVRYRLEPGHRRLQQTSTEELIRESVEFSLTVGAQVGGHGFVGVKVSKPFSF